MLQPIKATTPVIVVMGWRRAKTIGFMRAARVE
jgi:hypothetical protein